MRPPTTSPLYPSMRELETSGPGSSAAGSPETGCVKRRGNDLHAADRGNWVAGNWVAGSDLHAANRGCVSVCGIAPLIVGAPVPHRGQKMPRIPTGKASSHLGGESGAPRLLSGKGSRLLSGESKRGPRSEISFIAKAAEPRPSFRRPRRLLWRPQK